MHRSAGQYPQLVQPSAKRHKSQLEALVVLQFINDTQTILRSNAAL